MNGPSLTSSTAISAPNRPVATSTPSARERRREPPVEPLGEVWRRGAGEPGPAAPPRVGEQRELRDDQRRPADVEQRPVGPALVVAEDAQLGGLAGEVVGDRLGVVRTDPEQDHEARADRADDIAVDPDRRAGRPLEDGPHGGAGGGMTPCSAMNASRHASASRSYASRAAV